jgi:hypothetical protein
MCEVCYCQCNASDGGNFFDILTEILTFVTIIITLLSVVLSKRVEIRFTKFENLCLNIVNEKFDYFFNYINRFETEVIRLHLTTITELNTDFNLLLVELRAIYPKIDIDFLQNLSHEFTDKAYANQSLRMGILVSDFLVMKIKMLDKLYDYALRHEMPFLSMVFAFGRRR